MNPIELMDYVFDGVEGEFALLYGDRADLTSTANIPTKLPEGVEAFDMLLEDEGVVVGVPVDDVALATFSVTTKDGVEYFALFEEPVAADKIPESVEHFEVPVGDDCVTEIVTDKFVTFDEVFAVEDATFEDVESTTEIVNDATEPAPEVQETKAEQAVEEAAEPEFLNDAEVLGQGGDDLEEFLNRPATLMNGEMWGAKDRRNTQDGEWNLTTMPWINWILGGEKTKGTRAWGFSRHPEGADKAGSCIVLGSSIGKARKAKSMDEMYALGIDIDSGAKLDTVLAKIEDAGILCIVYTSFNNGKTGIELKRDEVLRKLKIKRDPDINEIRQYIREHSKDRYDESFLAECEIKNARTQTKDGVVIEISTPPLEKFRLIFPLAEPVKIIDLADTHQEALDMWANAVTGVAQNLLGVHFDTSCTDPSRLFYTARHPKGSEDWYCAIVQGEPLAFEDIEPLEKTLYTSNRDLNAFTMAGGGDDERPALAMTPKGKSLNEWHRDFKDRFMIADLLEHQCPDKIRVAGGEAAGSVHIECPFEHEHTSEGGTATMAINALDSQSEYWSVWCHHDACQGRKKLQFLEKMLQDEWFEEELLWDMDAGYVLEGEDEPEEEEEEEPEEERELTPEEMAGQFSDASSQEDIEKFLKRLKRRDQDDLTTRAKVTAALAQSTCLGKADLKKLWKSVDAEERQRQLDREREEEGTVAEVNRMDFDLICEYAHRRIHDTNRKKPSVFHYMDGLTSIRENSEGHARLRYLDKDGFAHHLNTVARFVKVSGEEETRLGVSAPRDVVDFLFAADKGTYPELRGLVTTPSFTASGAMLTEQGYDWESRLYYKPDNSLFVPEVKEKPTEEDIFEAKRLLIEEILADFPLGAMTRPEIVKHGLHGDGIAAVTNMIALILLPFMRELVDGPTPGHLLVKPAPGTGASLLTDVFSIISAGQVTPALAMPGNKDEMSKTLTSLLANGQGIVFFDNISHNVDSGELASAMTTPTYQARILGRSQTIEVDVRCAWVFTGNNVTLSQELVRRLLMIDLDARVENPEMREGFRHGDIRGWARENRGKLVWACLTLIQNWVSKGMVHQKDIMLASYENWSGAVGGVLKAAGLGGFMANRDALKAAATDTDGDDMINLLEAWWDQFGSKEVATKGDDKSPGLIELAMSEDISLQVKKEINADGDRVYNPRSFQHVLGKDKGRVFRLEDGTRVYLHRSDKRTKKGYMWKLVPQDDAPQSNVEAS